MNWGVFTFQGGTDRLIGLMQAELEHLGVAIRTASRVERIVSAKGRVTGVQVTSGGESAFIPVWAVVSNAGITNTIRMAGPEDLPVAISLLAYSM